MLLKRYFHSRKLAVDLRLTHLIFQILSGCRYSESRMLQGKDFSCKTSITAQGVL